MPVRSYHPLELTLIGREKELSDLNGQISNSDVTLVTGDSGIGKTRLVLEVCRNFEKKAGKFFA